MRIYPAAYLKLLAQLCRSFNILLIADEIAVGFGRTGKMFAFEHSGIDPDIVCVGKGLSGGYLPISAAVVKEEIYSTFNNSSSDNTFYHGHTFAGNPIAAAAALETLQIYEDEHIVGSAKHKGEFIGEKMAGIAALKGVHNVRRLGMIAAVELDDAGEKGCARAIAVKQALLRSGILLRPLGNVIYLMPPLVTPDDLLADTIRLIGEALESAG